MLRLLARRAKGDVWASLMFLLLAVNCARAQDAGLQTMGFQPAGPSGATLAPAGETAAAFSPPTDNGTTDSP
ncbi:MAG: hypothetical protein JOY66_16145, partial [Acetobacteraceae bacterium]|nr:hypothetical protein [Acetobacteraceae bacterium]